MAGSHGLPMVTLQVQVDLAPEVTAGQNMFLIICKYTPDVIRRVGCIPSQEVLYSPYKQRQSRLLPHYYSLHQQTDPDVSRLVTPPWTTARKLKQ